MAARFRVLVTDRAWPDTFIEQQILAKVDGEVIEPASTSEADLIAAAANVDAIATNWAKVTAAVVRASGKCQIVARFGIGLDNIAVDAATDLQIPVTNCPDYCVSEVSDHAMALLLACNRQIGLYHGRSKRGEYNPTTSMPIQRLTGQTLGLLGMGKIAQTLVPKARAFGLKIIAHNQSGQDYGTGIRMVTFDELLSSSDYISVHALLTSQTRHKFDEHAFRRMRPSAYLINTSRGGLINHAALWGALQQNQLAGVALDVFDPEPPDLGQSLFQDERVIVTPHAAFVSEQAIQQMRVEAMQNIVEALSERRPNNVVNQQIYSDR
ncbi:MAG TPA: C-terminal binding protein [Schlesneria sp.]|jgi:D-3-phosphoglycerate dehydrogenase